MNISDLQRCINIRQIRRLIEACILVTSRVTKGFTLLRFEDHRLYRLQLTFGKILLKPLFLWFFNILYMILSGLVVCLLLPSATSFFANYATSSKWILNLLSGKLSIYSYHHRRCTAISTTGSVRH